MAAPPPPCPFPKLHPSQLARDDAFFMSLAYNQAIDAWRAGEVPIGAIIAVDGEVVAAAHNTFETVQKAAKQATDVGEDNFQAMTSTAVKATQAQTRARRAA